MSKLQQKSQESMGEQCDGKIPLFHEFSRFVSRSVDTDMQIIAFARRYMEKTRGFKLISWINSERKSLIFAGIHLVTTLIIYQHFFYSKFRVQEAAIKEGANRYWEKRLIPPLEFGAMHAILFQMALLPLTMCRVSLARLAQTELERFVPFNRITAFHIHLGYTMITFVLVGTVVFFIFFGIMCDEQKRGIEPLNKKGEEQWCDKMTSEIMLTGIGILVALVLVLVTSYLRDRIPYELFYNVHHIVFLMFAVTVAHTLDVDQRSGAKARSQTFKWFSASLAYYILDRAYAHVSMSFKCIVDWSGTHALSQSNDHSERVVVLKFTRPGALRFVPGQYVYLRIPAIDGTWHPYSVGSGPMDKSLLFFIEVYQQGSWSDRLWKLIHETSADKAISAMPLEEIFVDVQGPFGAAVANVARFTDCVAIGAGTGVVPMLSLLRQNTDRLRLIHPDSFVDYTRDMKKKLKHYVATTSTHNATLATKLRKSVSGLFGYADFDSVAIQQNTQAIPGITSSERRNTNSLARDNSLRKSLTRGDSIRRKTLNRKSQFSAVAYTNVANSLAGTKDLLWSRVKTAHVDELAACRIQVCDVFTYT
jgi:predicted ferric reductase